MNWSKYISIHCKLDNAGNYPFMYNVHVYTNLCIEQKLFECYAQQRLRSVWASAQSDQGLCSVL